jgi:hypothetical protein
MPQASIVDRTTVVKLRHFVSGLFRPPQSVTLVLPRRSPRHNFPNLSSDFHDFSRLPCTGA